MTQIKAIAHIQPTTGQSISGTLLLSQDDGTTTLSLNLTGGAPNSTHGFHLHAFGDMSDPKGANAFGHFNPSNASHGCPDAGQTSPIKLKTGFHFGDLGSITVDNNGNAKQTWISTELDLNDSSTLGFVLGRGVIVHNMTDDCTTQPTGNSGSRLAQGVIATAGEDHVYETQNVPPASKDNAIAVFKGSVSGNVVAIKHAAADQLVLKYNLTGLPTNQSFNLAVTGYETGKTSNGQNCKDTVSSLASDVSGRAVGQTTIASSSFPGIKGLLGQYLMITTKECQGQEYLAYTPIGARNATLDSTALTSTTNTTPTAASTNLINTSKVGTISVSITVMVIAAVFLL